MTTKHPIEHMLAIHSCDKQGKVIQHTQSILEQQQHAAATYNVVTAFDITKFWAILLHWIVNTHISFSKVEHLEFHKLLLYCNALFIDVLLLSYNMISSQILRIMKLKRFTYNLSLKHLLAKSISALIYGLLQTLQHF